MDPATYQNMAQAQGIQSSASFPPNLAYNSYLQPQIQQIQQIQQQSTSNSSYPYSTPNQPHQQQHTQTLTTSPINGGFFNPWDPPPPYTPPPFDAELQKRIEKLAEYSAKNGPQFEALMREKQQSNAAYSFLLGGEGFEYYRYKLWSYTMAAQPQPQGAQQQQQQTPAQPAMPPSHTNPTQYYGFQTSQPSQSPQSLPQTSIFAPQQHQQQLHLQQQQGLPPPLPGVPQLPTEVGAEFSHVLNSLSGTKEGIKAGKAWFMGRAAWAPALARAFQGRVQGLTVDRERQMHVVFLVNDILFHSLQQRSNPAELDPVSLAFQPVLGSLLAAVYRGGESANQERLRKILEFWGSKGVFDGDSILRMEAEMTSEGYQEREEAQIRMDPAASLPAPSPAAAGSASGPYFPQNQWQQPNALATQQMPLTGFSNVEFYSQSTPQQLAPPAPVALPPSFSPSPFPEPPKAKEPPSSDSEPPYPLFPPGLIPGMVRKMQIGSGVPYSPISPLDIPTQIPPQTASETHILKRIKKYFKTIGETDPLADENYVSSDEEGGDGRNGAVVRKKERGGGVGGLSGIGGSSIGGGGGGIGVHAVPPPLMEVDPETGMLPDGSVAAKGLGNARAGLGAQTEEDESQYGDVYSTYRKSRSSNYHTAMTSRAAMKYEHA